MIFPRKKNLEQLIKHQNNGLIKIITGLRRSGKSYLLDPIFKNYLLETGIKEDHIIKLDLEKQLNSKYWDPNELAKYLESCIVDKEKYYFLLDEIQLVKGFEFVLNGLLHIPNVDVYVTGSNSKFLSSDIISEFRGRGDEIRVFPLTFSEYYESVGGNKHEALISYMHYGGLPQCASTDDLEVKQHYLVGLYKTIYLADLKQRHRIKEMEVFDNLLEILSSDIGSFTNFKKLSNTFKTVLNVNVSFNTIKRYCEYLEDAFLINQAKRYDIKGKNHIASLKKIYFTDLGIRNALIGFRQYEASHLMENLIYNELCYRGFSVDVGTIIKNTIDKNKKNIRNYFEVDFVANKGFKRYYIQSALIIPDAKKMAQEEKSLDYISDNFQKVIIVYDDFVTYHQNEKGYIMMNLIEFLEHPEYIN